jgi:hypothetical protein
MSRLLILTLSIFAASSIPLEYDITVKENKKPSYNIFLEDEFSLKRVRSFLYSINFYIGTPSQKFEAVLDTGSFITWVMDKEIISKHKYDEQTKYECHKSTTCYPNGKNFTIQYVTGNASGYLIEDIISLNSAATSEVVYPMTFLSAFYVADLGSDFNGLIGLGKGNDSVDERFSIVKYFYDNKLIDKKIFSLKSSGSGGKFYLGDFHSDFNKGFAKCNTVNKGKYKDFWGCRLSYILIGETDGENFFTNSHKANKLALIDSGSSGIIAPFTVFPIFKAYFEKLIEEKKCAWHFARQILFTCNIDTNFEDLPPAYFVLNGYGLKLPAKELFNKYEDEFYAFVIMFDSEIKFWIIGQPIFMKYHVLFNTEENSVGFQGEFENFRQFTTDDDINPDDYIPQYGGVTFYKLPSVLILIVLLALIY